MLFGRQLFAGFAQRFSVTGDTRPGTSGKDRRFVNADFVVEQAMLDDFKKFVTSSGVKVDPAGWDADAVFVKAMIRYDIALGAGVSSARRHLLDLDPQAQFALSLFKKPSS